MSAPRWSAHARTLRLSLRYDARRTSAGYIVQYLVAWRRAATRTGQPRLSVTNDVGFSLLTYRRRSLFAAVVPPIIVACKFESSPGRAFVPHADDSPPLRRRRALACMGGSTAVCSSRFFGDYQLSCFIIEPAADGRSAGRQCRRRLDAEPIKPQATVTMQSVSPLLAER